MIEILTRKEEIQSRIETQIVTGKIIEIAEEEKRVSYRGKEVETWKALYQQKWVHTIVIIRIDNNLVMYPYHSKSYLNDEIIDLELTYAFISM